MIAAPLAGLAGAAAARAEVDRVFDSAERHPGAIGQVTSLDEARTTVLLDEIVSQVADGQRWSTRGCASCATRTRCWPTPCGPISTASATSPRPRSGCTCTPNTVRYRVRRIEKLLSTSLDDPDVRLVLALGLRATADA